MNNHHQAGSLASILRLLAGLALLVLPGTSAAAKTVTDGGLTFSDELGSFRIVDVTGDGSLDAPFVVVEEITGSKEAILTIRGLSLAFANRIGTTHLTGLALTKVVTNRTAHNWNLFEMQVREHPDMPSPYSDGLSFGQGSTVGRPFRSDVFKTSEVVDEPYDAVMFADGVVHPNETVSFHIVITHMSPVSPIFLLERPTWVVSNAPDVLPPPEKLADRPVRVAGTRHSLDPKRLGLSPNHNARARSR